MQIAQGAQAIPWQFATVEREQLQQIFATPLVQAYIGALKHLALTNKLADPEATAMTVEQSNAYMSGQEYILDALSITDSNALYVPMIPTNTTGEE